MTLSRSVLAGTAAATIMALATAFPTLAASTVVVTPSNPHGWGVVTSDTTPDAAINFVLDPTSPAGPGALQLTTGAASTSKATYQHPSGDSLLSLTALSYWTKQNSATFPQGDPSYQLVTLLKGSSGYSTLVYEPYLNPGDGSVIPNLWQKWNVFGGQWWSTRAVDCSGGPVASRTVMYSLAQLKALCPEAVVLAYGVNVGSGNPSWNVETDLFQYNDTFYDFELDPASTSTTTTTTTTGGTTGGGATPELDSLLLFGAGLSGMGGYAVMRLRARRRR